MPKGSEDRDSERLATPVADRVLERASEFDALRNAGTSVAELRAAAAEAGISDVAFDAALGEVRSSTQRQGRTWALVAGMLATVAMLWLVLSLLMPTPVSTPVTEQAFLLRCLPVAEAGELIKPILNLPENSVVISPEHAPRVITIRGTPEQFRQIRTLFDKYEGTGTSCPQN